MIRRSVFDRGAAQNIQLSLTNHVISENQSVTIISAQPEFFELSYSEVGFVCWFILDLFVVTPTSLSLEVLFKYWKVHVKLGELRLGR